MTVSMGTSLHAGGLMDRIIKIVCNYYGTLINITKISIIMLIK
jgi:hypothetical protein